MIQSTLEYILNYFSPIVIMLLEIFGIIIVILGSIKAIYLFFKNKMNFHSSEVRITLGQALSLSLEFKLGAEIIKTVLLHTLDELLVLAFVIGLRVLLTFVIHWEIKHTGDDGETSLN